MACERKPACESSIIHEDLAEPQIILLGLVKKYTYDYNTYEYNKYDEGGGDVYQQR
jgi:hypothetical protein